MAGNRTPLENLSAAPAKGALGGWFEAAAGREVAEVVEVAAAVVQGGKKGGDSGSLSITTVGHLRFLGFKIGPERFGHTCTALSARCSHPASTRVSSDPL